MFTFVKKLLFSPPFAVFVYPFMGSISLHQVFSIILSLISSLDKVHDCEITSFNNKEKKESMRGLHNFNTGWGYPLFYYSTTSPFVLVNVVCWTLFQRWLMTPFSSLGLKQLNMWHSFSIEENFSFTSSPMNDLFSWTNKIVSRTTYIPMSLLV